MPQYGYVHDPLGWLDPNGLKSCKIKKATKDLVGPKPEGMVAAHYHHIVMEGKFSRWAEGNRKYVEGAQKILEQHGVDIHGPHNIQWAKNEGHSVEYAKTVYNALEKGAQMGKEGVIKALMDLR